MTKTNRRGKLVGDIHPYKRLLEPCLAFNSYRRPEPELMLNLEYANDVEEYRPKRDVSQHKKLDEGYLNRLKVSVQSSNTAAQAHSGLGWR